MQKPQPSSEYLVLSRGQWDAHLSPEEIQAAIDDFYAWHGQLVAAGRMRAGSRLTREGKRVSRQAVVDGPFSESKEIIGGYWHVIAGGVEAGETDPEAARRELEEETGLAADVGEPLHSYVYDEVRVVAFLVDVPPGWEPRLDEEHDDHRWCTVDEARRLLRWADAADSVARLASQ